MIEAKIPKDIRSYKTKIVGPLNLRQLICATIAVIVDAIMFFGFFKDSGLSPRVIMLICIIVDVIIFAFSFDINGMHMEDYLKEVFEKNFLWPAKRRAKKDLGTPVKKMSESEQKKHDKIVAKKIKENPMFKPYK